MASTPLQPIHRTMAPDRARSSIAFWYGLTGLGAIVLLGGVGAVLGSWSGGHWTSALTGGLFGLGAGAGIGAGLLLLLTGDEPGPQPTPRPPEEELWLSDHERWDRLLNQVARRQRVPQRPRTSRHRPKSRPPLSR